MAGSTKAPTGFWSMGSTIRQAPRPAASKLGALLGEIQSRLKSGDLSRAMTLAEQAVKIADNVNTRLALATVCLVSRDPKRAEANYMEVLRHEPDHFKALLGLGQLKLNTGQPEAAIKVLETALKKEPNSADARHLLARSYGSLGRFDEAIKLFAQLVVEAPRNADIWSGYGRALTKQGMAEEAIKAYRKALELKPGDDAIHQGLGAAYLSIGEIEQAEQHLRNATKLKPERGAPFSGLAKLKRLDEEELAEAKRQLSTLSPDDPKRRTFLSAIAAMAEKAKDYDEAFRAISEAMSLAAARARVKYSPDIIESVTDTLIPLIGAPLRYSFPPPAVRPVFIIGMPRSGSTLTEQVLARHPSVFAAGEWPALKQVLEAMTQLGKTYPEGLPRLSAEDAARTRGIYYEKLPELESAKMVLTDKLLGNVFHLPVIESIFPEARIVRCRRHPMDIVWSIMTQMFGSNVPYAHKLEDICHHMLQQHRILSVWSERGTLPTLEIFYEELVDSFEAGARSLVEFAGLPWDDACLTPQDSRRAVLTASAGQVHQPVSKSSIGRWKPFAPYLGHAVETLRPLIRLHETELAKRGVNYDS